MCQILLEAHILTFSLIILKKEKNDKKKKLGNVSAHKERTSEKIFGFCFKKRSYHALNRARIRIQDVHDVLIGLAHRLQ